MMETKGLTDLGSSASSITEYMIEVNVRGEIPREPTWVPFESPFLRFNSMEAALAVYSDIRLEASIRGKRLIRVTTNTSEERYVAAREWPVPLSEQPLLRQVVDMPSGQLVIRSTAPIQCEFIPWGSLGVR